MKDNRKRDKLVNKPFMFQPIFFIAQTLKYKIAASNVSFCIILVLKNQMLIKNSCQKKRTTFQEVLNITYYCKNKNMFRTKLKCELKA